MADENENTSEEDQTQGATNSPDPRDALGDGEHVHETSRFTETDDNSVLLEDEGFVGVSTEYRNAAYDSSKPLRSEDEDAAKVEELAKAAEVETAMRGEQVGFRGFKTDTPHPSERKNLADEALKHRARQDEEARQEARHEAQVNDDADTEEDDETETTQSRNPFGRR